MSTGAARRRCRLCSDCSRPAGRCDLQVSLLCSLPKHAARRAGQRSVRDWYSERACSVEQQLPRPRAQADVRVQQLLATMRTRDTALKASSRCARRRMRDHRSNNLTTAARGA